MLKGHRVSQDHKELPAQLEQLVLQAKMVLKAHKVQQVQPVQQAQMDLQEQLDLQAHKAKPVHKALKVFQGHRAPLALKGLRALRVNVALKAPRETASPSLMTAIKTAGMIG